MFGMNRYMLFVTFTTKQKTHFDKFILNVYFLNHFLPCISFCVVHSSSLVPFPGFGFSAGHFALQIGQIFGTL